MSERRELLCKRGREEEGGKGVREKCVHISWYEAGDGG